MPHRLKFFGWGRWHQRTPKLFLLLDPADARLDTASTDVEMEYLTKPLTAGVIALKVRFVLNSRKQQKKVLIVDNDESLRRRLAALLEAAGYEITQASNGREALNRAGTLEAETILTEIVMPEVEGLQLIQELLRLNPSQRIIAMSGAHRAESYLATAKLLGAKATFTKPLPAESCRDLPPGLASAMTAWLQMDPAGMTDRIANFCRNHRINDGTLQPSLQ